MRQRLANARLQSWHIATASMGALMVAIAVGGLITWGINLRVKAITEQAITTDIALEDRSDDFRVAVLDMRHYHRNITFSGSSRRGLQDYDAAYTLMMDQIDRLYEVEVDDPRFPDLDALRQQAETYYTDFRSAIELRETAPLAFNLASDQGLVQLAELENTGRTLDSLGEQRAAAALASVERAADSAQTIQLVVLGLVTLAGMGLAYLTIRTVREQQRVSAELANALQLKNDFIADASHELRTPLTVLRANAELARDLDPAYANVDLLDEIIGEADRMTRLVGDLLLLAGSDAKSLTLEIDLVPLGPFLTQLAERAQTFVLKHNHHFAADLRSEGLIQMDAVRIEQAILALVDNAAKYSPEGTTITLRSTTRNQTAIIEVIDQGIGIPKAELPLVFERFYRVDKSRSRKQGGTGLGLPIARSIVNAHGGRLEAESETGVGTTMRLYLALLPASG
jgi:signal transduction histidine kinase